MVEKIEVIDMPNDQSQITPLQAAIDEICARYEISHRQEFTNKLFCLTDLHQGKINKLTRGQLYPGLEEVQKNARKLALSLQKLDAKSIKFLPDIVTDTLPSLLHNCDLLESVIAKSFKTSSIVKDIKGLTTKRFVKLCVDYDVPITWSKSSCEFSLSARLLAAVFSADGKTNTNEEPSANYHIGKLCKGFVCEIDRFDARIYFDRVEFEPSPFVNAIIGWALDGGERPSVKDFPASVSVREHDLSLGYPERKGSFVFRTGSKVIG